MDRYEAIVLGTGGVGSAALFHLARRGVRVLGLDRFPPAHDRGSSHGQTRMIRQAYFEHPDYVPLVLRAYRLWDELAQRRNEALYDETGLVEVGPADGIVVPGVLASARQHGLEVDTLSAEEIASRWPGFHVPEGLTGVFERRAGYLRVEPCVRAHLEEAIRQGATLRTGVTIRSWRAAGTGAIIETDHGAFAADRLIVTAGAWAGELLHGLGLALEVRRKPQYWYQTASPAYRVEQGCPSFLFEIVSGLFYGFPQIDDDGIKIAQHSGGATVADPLTIDRGLDAADQARVEAFAAACLPLATRQLTRHAVCMYTMTLDEHFVVDRHPDHPQVVFAAGLSGHGFKFACVLGEILADLALTGRTTLPAAFLSCQRPGLRQAAPAAGMPNERPDTPGRMD